MPSIREQYVPLVSLFLGMVMLTMGASLQGTLIGIRAIDENFSTNTIGLFGSSYFLGFIGGTMVTAFLIERAGHIRCFTALASLYSAGALGHIIFVDEISWILLRAATGLAMAGIFVTMESWLNERAGNEERGQILSMYFFVNLGGMTIGQWLLVLSDPEGYVLFCVVSILMSVSLVPIALTRTKAPVPPKPRPLPVRQVFSVSPLGFIGALAFGLAMGAFWGLAPVFADHVAASTGDVALFMSLCILGGGLMQMPMGWLSDHFDRRLILMLVAFAGSCAALALANLGASHPEWIFYLAFAFGAASFPLNAIAVSHANDFAGPDERVLVSGTLLMVYGAGAVLGPFFGGLVMDRLGDPGLFYYISAVFGLVAIYALWRTTRRESIAQDEKGRFVPHTATTHIATQLDPEAAPTADASNET